MTDIHFTVGDTDEAISIIREAAQWLTDSGKPMWHLDELTPERLVKPDNEFMTLWRGDESAATLILSFYDPFFWPDVGPGESGFIHKLAVRRKFAGQGLAEALIRHTADLCRERGIPALRLDCDPHRPKLCAFYESVGFRLTEVRAIETKRLGVIDLAMYRMEV